MKVARRAVLCLLLAIPTALYGTPLSPSAVPSSSWSSHPGDWVIFGNLSTINVVGAAGSQVLPFTLTNFTFAFDPGISYAGGIWLYITPSVTGLYLIGGKAGEGNWATYTITPGSLSTFLQLATRWFQPGAPIFVRLTIQGGLNPSNPDSALVAGFLALVTGTDCIATPAPPSPPPPPIPEPATMLLMGSGMAAMGLRRFGAKWRRKTTTPI
ncbi:MAG TPA: PEP-CTERM sorting domain-containing protein [Candidatus Binatia bacterium]|nr:PEP-CTERM sorting domain-containing protein [Candidatus Binatia bacterium]